MHRIQVYWQPAIAILLMFLVSCATPVAPTGGEPDKTGPKIVSTFPANGTINFSNDEVSFTFDDYVNRNSFRNALTIEPGINVEYKIRWRRKTAIIEFQDVLPESTTIIFSLSSELRDMRNNPIPAPITLGLSTGPVIDRGEVKLRVIGLQPSSKVNEVSVLLYRIPFDLDNPANYISTPDTGGVVKFSYLSEGKYAGLLLHDINRNRIWESNREFAQPLPVEYFDLDVDGTIDLGNVFYARRDTSRPDLQGVGLLSSNRLRLRFSKPIQYKRGQGIQIQRQQDGRLIDAYHLFNDSSTESISYFHSSESLDAEFTYQLQLGALVDANNNSIRPSDIEFDGSDESDTTMVRFMGNISAVGLRPEDPIILQYSSEISDSELTDSLKVYVNRSLSESAVNVRVENNLLILSPQSHWIEANDYDIRAWNPATGSHVNVQPRIIRNADLGDLEITIADNILSDEPMKLILYDDRNQIAHQVDFTSNITIEGVRNGSYRLVVFHDITGDGIWDFGSLNPYRQPARIYVDQRLPIRSQMTSNVEVTFSK